MYIYINVDIREGLRVCVYPRIYMRNDIMRLVRVPDVSSYIISISMHALLSPPFRQELRYSEVRDISVFMCPVGHGEKPWNDSRATPLYVRPSHPRRARRM